MVVNFGQWDLGWPRQRRTPVDEYAGIVAEFVHSLGTNRHKVIWMTNNPVEGDGKYGYFECPKREWRDLQQIAHYNDAANTIMRKNHIRIWDTTAVLNDVFDRTFDHAHFAPWVKGGLMTALQARVDWNWRAAPGNASVVEDTGSSSLRIG